MDSQISWWKYAERKDYFYAHHTYLLDDNCKEEKER